ncbi:hypothetical protein [Paraglaciecola arctica]|uniref:hypothetical protein n=1 Tax=Paraglaciecola arctica TaxID=1128911 RepID=UPI001C06B528|nr:hypothetical protein [Paraglaciecola arctica]MBU3001918.1 hypothetical protein [Paraglaciecola arctica]
MAATQSKTIDMSRFWITMFLGVLLLSNSQSASSNTLNNSNALTSQTWKGESAGFVNQGDPTKDDVAFLVVLGHVQAAIRRANHRDKENSMKNPFTPQLMKEYAIIDPFVTGKSNTNLSLQPLLSEVAAPDSFLIITDTTPSTRKQRNAIHTQLKNLILRVDAIVIERFPSTHSSALAMSALLREAAELLRQGLSMEGQILNVSRYRDALQLVEASLSLNVNKAILCDRSREAVKQLKSRGPLGDLLDRLIIISKSGAVNANAGDVFDAAEKLRQLGASLPNNDSEICK